MERKESIFEKIVNWIKFLADLLTDAKEKYDRHFNKSQNQGNETNIVTPVGDGD